MYQSVYITYMTHKKSTQSPRLVNEDQWQQRVTAGDVNCRRVRPVSTTVYTYTTLGATVQCRWLGCWCFYRSGVHLRWHQCTQLYDYVGWMVSGYQWIQWGVHMVTSRRTQAETSTGGSWSNWTVNGIEIWMFTHWISGNLIMTCVLHCLPAS